MNSRYAGVVTMSTSASTPLSDDCAAFEMNAGTVSDYVDLSQTEQIPGWKCSVNKACAPATIGVICMSIGAVLCEDNEIFKQQSFTKFFHKNAR